MPFPKIKVVHISTSATGGAGTAAYRIHEAMLRSGIDSHFVCIDSNIDQNLQSCSRLRQPNNNSPYKVFKDKIKWRLKKHFNIVISQKDYFRKELHKIYPELKCEIATLPFSDYNISEDPIVQNADIIHLHWVADLLDYPSFFKKNIKPVVWTLHDMNPFQGIFHYKQDEERNGMLASDLNTRIFNIKQKAITNKKGSLLIVCPSLWLLHDAMESKMFKDAKGYHISYALNTQIFSPHTNDNLKSKLGIPEKNTIFLFVAQSVENYRKGFDILIEALNHFKDIAVTLLVIGNHHKLEITGLDIRMIGTINDNIILRDYYSLADAFIIPSREDNLPNVMLESMACGTPVLSFNVGGMAEIIKDGFNGLKAHKTDARELVTVMNEFIKVKENFTTELIRNFAVENFSENVISEKYMNVYTSLFQNNA